MKKRVPVAVRSEVLDARSMIAGLRDLYASVLQGSLPQEWLDLAERFEARQAGTRADGTIPIPKT